MNSSYSLEKLAWARQEDIRREARSVELLPLLPGLAQASRKAALLYPMIVAVCAAALIAFLIIH